MKTEDFTRSALRICIFIGILLSIIFVWDSTYFTIKLIITDALIFLGFWLFAYLNNYFD